MQKPWMVEIQAPSSSRARSWRPRAASAARMRERSSPAARFGVRDHEHRVDVEALVADRADEALDEHGRLAGARAGGDEDRAARLDGRGCCSGSADGHARATRHIVQRSHHAGHSPPFGSCRRRRRGCGRASVRAVSRAPSTCAQNASSSR